jgi:hypothetical protein
MDFAQGRVASYVNRENGATSPGRWPLWQFFCRIGNTSLWKVGAANTDKATRLKAGTNKASRIHQERIEESCGAQRGLGLRDD